jgi:hypothetical protein
MALGTVLGVEKLRMVGKLSDAQVAMDDTALNADLVSVYDNALTDNGLVIKSGTSLYKAFNRSLRKFILEAQTEQA